MDRVLFLDVDGVLNSVTYYEMNQKILDPMLEQAEWIGGMDDPERLIDPEAVTRLNRIVQVVGPTIVVHSNWRKSFDVNHFNRLLDDRGFDGTVDELAPVPNDPPYDNRTAEGRTRQITELIRSKKPNQSVVLDDLDLDLQTDHLPGRVRFIRTDSQYGMTETDVEEVIEFFEEEPEG